MVGIPRQARYSAIENSSKGLLKPCARIAAATPFAGELPHEMKVVLE